MYAGAVSLWNRLATMSTTSLLRLVLFAILAVVVTHTPSDPDLWGHVAFGRDMVRDATVHAVDPYAFTSEKEWLNHEILSEVAMYGAYSLGGGTGLIVLKLLLVIATLCFVARAIARTTARLFTRDLFMSLTVLCTFPQTTHVRPQLFSVLLFSLLLYILIEVDRGCRWKLSVVPLLMATWVNFHGGWIVGAGTLGLWATGGLFNASVDWTTWARRVGICVVAVLATLVNPYGIGMWAFLLQTVGFSREIVEWRPIFEIGPMLMMLWLLNVLVALAVLKRARPLPWAYVAVVVALGGASLAVNRLLVFFTLSTMMLLAPELPWRGPSKRAEGVGSPSRHGPLPRLHGRERPPCVRTRDKQPPRHPDGRRLASRARGCPVRKGPCLLGPPDHLVRLGRVCPVAFRARPEDLDGWTAGDDLLERDPQQPSTVLLRPARRTRVRTVTGSRLRLAAQRSAHHEPTARRRMATDFQRTGFECVCEIGQTTRGRRDPRCRIEQTLPGTLVVPVIWTVTHRGPAEWGRARSALREEGAYRQ
ncbi:MAG: hypothetical protein QF681_16205, partial [Vicinamibacterales bacterium]|nr:hypothetical protein [Vicinamibacterales bacterium]